ncbi:MAG: tetratricopeptide repeat protein, partial [Muribaculaceae bacterium]|nr:tetratricopeptide repeat protein [Muribaculaceae bacterium]
DPTSLDTYAWIMFRKRDFAKAKDYIDTALANNSEDSEELLHHAGDIYFMAGFPDEAVTYWTEALKLDPDNELLQRKVRHKTYFVK